MMNLWTVASIFMLALIFWLNAAMVAVPYVSKLSGRATPRINKNAVVTAILLLFANCTYFMLIVDDLAGDGIAGMLDPMYIEFIRTGPIGQFVLLQTSVGVLWLVYAAVGGPPVRWLIYAIAVVLMSWSFLSIGHSSDAAWWAKIAFLTHLCAAWLWFGSLNALRNLATSVPASKAKAIMETFGAHMSVAVPALIVAGVALYRSATEQWLPRLPLNSYELVLGVKLVCVMLILAMAAIHKLKFVPQLNDESAAKRLKKSITLEMVLAVIIIVLAMTLSSGLSPR